MKWPWQAQRLAVEQVHREVAEAIEQKEAAKRRREHARAQAAQSAAVSGVLCREIAKNGFTELLQAAMGSR